jgi:hypothetical protein
MAIIMSTVQCHGFFETPYFIHWISFRYECKGRFLLSWTHYKEPVWINGHRIILWAENTSDSSQTTVALLKTAPYIATDKTGTAENEH